MSKRKITHRLYQTAQPEVLLDYDIYVLLASVVHVNWVDVPFTAAMTNRICIVSVAHVKWV